MMIQILTALSGILASFIAWFAVSSLVKPKIKIDDELYRFKSIDNEGSFVYKVKVTNSSRFFSIYDVNLAARAYIYGLNPERPEEHKTYVINTGVKNSPYIASNRKNSNHATANECYFALRPPYNENKDKGKLRKLYNKNHPANPLDGVMLLEDVFHIVESEKFKTKIEFSITATSEFSASRAFVTKCYRLENINNIDMVDQDSQDE